MKKIFILIVTIAIIFSMVSPCSAATKKDASQSHKITNRNLAIAYAKANYPKCKIKIVSLNKKGWKKITHRKGKKIVYIEKCITISNGKGEGFTKKDHYYVAYNKKVKKGKKVTSYFVYNPYTNYCDDVVAVVDNKMIR